MNKLQQPRSRTSPFAYDGAVVERHIGRMEELSYQTNWQTVKIGSKYYGISASRVYDFETGRFLDKDPVPTLMRVGGAGGNAMGIYGRTKFSSTIAVGAYVSNRSSASYAKWFLNEYRAWSSNPVQNVDGTGLWDLLGSLADYVANEVNARRAAIQGIYDMLYRGTTQGRSGEAPPVHKVEDYQKDPPPMSDGAGRILGNDYMDHTANGSYCPSQEDIDRANQELEDLGYELAQGLANDLNALQDEVIGLLNQALRPQMAPGVPIPFIPAPFHIDSPDWSKDLFVPEPQSTHDLEKAIAGFFEAILISHQFAPKCPCPTTVSRWGRPGLRPGDWVMKGPKSPWTFLRSFKWEWKWLNPSNEPVPFRDWPKGEEFTVPSDMLKWPPGWEKFKGIFGQRKYGK